MSAPTAVTAELLRGLPLPRASDDSDKDGRGRVLVIAGSPECRAPLSSRALRL